VVKPRIERERRLGKKGEQAWCPACKQVKRILARNLCVTCFTNPDVRNNFDTHRRSRPKAGEEEGARVKSLESVYLKFIKHRVVHRVTRKFRSFQYHDRMELVQEALAVAWELFCRCVEDGHDPLNQVESIARWAVKKVAHWQYVNGMPSKEDVLSPRFRTSGAMGEVPFSHVVRSLRACRPLRSERDVDWEDWLLTLDDFQYQVVQFLHDGNGVEDTRLHFNLNWYQWDEVRESLYQSWLTSR
jgi:hypothetical protein